MEEYVDVDVDTIARDVILAASLEEPAVEQPLSPVQLSPDTLQRARPILATRRRPLPVGVEGLAVAG